VLSLFTFDDCAALVEAALVELLPHLEIDKLRTTANTTGMLKPLLDKLLAEKKLTTASQLPPSDLTIDALNSTLKMRGVLQSININQGAAQATQSAQAVEEVNGEI